MKNLLLKPDIFIRSIINIITLNVRYNNEKIRRNEFCSPKKNVRYFKLHCQSCKTIKIIF